MFVSVHGSVPGLLRRVEGVRTDDRVQEVGLAERELEDHQG